MGRWRHRSLVLFILAASIVNWCRAGGTVLSLKLTKPYSTECLVDLIPYHMVNPSRLNTVDQHGVSTTHLLSREEKITDAVRAGLVQRLVATAAEAGDHSRKVPSASTACPRCVVPEYIRRGYLASTLLHISDGIKTAVAATTTATDSASAASSAAHLETAIEQCRVYVPKAYTIAWILSPYAHEDDALFFWLVSLHPSSVVHSSSQYVVYEVFSETMKLSRWSTPRVCVVVVQSTSGPGGGLYTRVDAASPIWPPADGSGTPGYYTNKYGHLHLIDAQHSTTSGPLKIITDQTGSRARLYFNTHSSMTDAAKAPFVVNPVGAINERTDVVMVDRLDFSLALQRRQTQLHWIRNTGVELEIQDPNLRTQLELATRGFTNDNSSAASVTMSTAVNTNALEVSGFAQTTSGGHPVTVMLGRETLQTLARGVAVTFDTASSATIHVLWQPVAATDTSGTSHALSYLETALLIWILFLALSRKFPAVAPQFNTLSINATTKYINVPVESIQHPVIHNSWLQFILLSEQAKRNTLAPRPLSNWLDQFSSVPTSSIVDLQIYILTLAFVIWRLVQSNGSAGSGLVAWVVYTTTATAFIPTLVNIFLFLRKAYLLEKGADVESSGTRKWPVPVRWIAHAFLPGALLSWIVSRSTAASTQGSKPGPKTSMPRVVYDSLARHVLLDTFSELCVFLSVGLLCSWDLSRSLNLVVVNLAAHLLVYMLYFRTLKLALILARLLHLKTRAEKTQVPPAIEWIWLALALAWLVALLSSYSVVTLQVLFFPYVIVAFAVSYSTETVVGLVWTTWSAIGALTVFRFLSQIQSAAEIAKLKSTATDITKAK